MYLVTKVIEVPLNVIGHVVGCFTSYMMRVPKAIYGVLRCRYSRDVYGVPYRTCVILFSGITP